MRSRRKGPPTEAKATTVGHGLHFWLPLGMSLAAVTFSGLQWIDTHQERSLSMRPLLNFVLENDPDDADWIGLAIKNNGPGPAILNSVSFYVDHKVVENIDEVAEIGKLNPKMIRSEG